MRPGYHTITILEIKHNDPVPGFQKNDEPYTYQDFSIKFKEGWINGRFFEQAEQEKMLSKGPGDTLYILIYKELFNGKDLFKFKLPYGPVASRAPNSIRAPGSKLKKQLDTWNYDPDDERLND